MSQFRRPMFGSRFRGYARGTRARKSIRVPIPGSSLQNQLLAYYTLSDVNDSTAAGRNLTNGNTVTFSAGKVGNAAAFAVANPPPWLHSANTGFNLSATSLSIAMWFNADSFNGGNNYLLYKYDGSANGYVLNAPNSASLQFVIAGPGTQTILEWTTSFGTGTWRFLAARYDFTNETMKLRVDNGADVTVAHTGGLGAATVSEFVLGGQDGVSFPWQGKLDECGVWNRALTDAEVLSLWSNGNGITWPI